MKKTFFIGCLAFLLLSCNNEKAPETATPATTTTTEKTTVDLPYKASYSSNFTHDVSDADLKMVMMTYKDWADGNLASLEKSLGDTVSVEMSDGNKMTKPKADIMKLWGPHRDSLSSVNIDMAAWHSIYEPDKKDVIVLTWYKEIDTYKTGKVDSANYHDVNVVKNGKLVFYSTYKQPLK